MQVKDITANLKTIAEMIFVRLQPTPQSSQWLKRKVNRSLKKKSIIPRKFK
jgi:hypothetical protein